MPENNAMNDQMFHRMPPIINETNTALVSARVQKLLKVKGWLIIVN